MRFYKAAKPVMQSDYRAVGDIRVEIARCKSISFTCPITPPRRFAARKGKIHSKGRGFMSVLREAVCDVAIRRHALLKGISSGFRSLESGFFFNPIRGPI
jgi:hypothetical protein